MYFDLTAFPSFKNGHSGVLPPDYRSPILRGAKVQAVTIPLFGMLVAQDLEGPGYQLHVMAADLMRNCRLAGIQQSSQLVALLAMKKNCFYWIDGLGHIVLKQGQFILAYLNPAKIMVSLKKGMPSELLSVALSPGLFNEALPHFAWLSGYLAPGLPRPSTLLCKARPANVRIMDIANDILSNPYDEAIGKLLYENKVREYLLECLIEAGKKAPPKIKLTHAERQLIIGIGEQITANPDKKFPINVLTVQAGMNSIKLKHAFKEIHGRGIFEHQLVARMEEARRLLMETDLSTKQVASKIGYKLTTSFITRFKQYFGYYSSEVRRNNY
jgi:AraC-like DNA-binding protein